MYVVMVAPLGAGWQPQLRMLPSTPPARPALSALVGVGTLVGLVAEHLQAAGGLLWVARLAAKSLRAAPHSLLRQDLCLTNPPLRTWPSAQFSTNAPVLSQVAYLGLRAGASTRGKLPAFCLACGQCGAQRGGECDWVGGRLSLCVGGGGGDRGGSKLDVIIVWMSCNVFAGSVFHTTLLG